MIDLKLLEKDFENISSKLKLKGVNEAFLEEIQNLFKEKKELKTKLDKLLEKRNKLSKEIGKLIKNKSSEAQKIKDEVNNLNQLIRRKTKRDRRDFK